jgi:hypothetical protein
LRIIRAIRIVRIVRFIRILRSGIGFGQPLWHHRGAGGVIPGLRFFENSSPGRGRAARPPFGEKQTLFHVTPLVSLKHTCFR